MLNITETFLTTVLLCTVTVDLPYEEVSKGCVCEYIFIEYLQRGILLWDLFIDDTCTFCVIGRKDT